MWSNKLKAADGVSAIDTTMVTGDLVIDGKELKNLLSLAKHLVEKKQLEFIEEIKPLIDVGLIIENQHVKINEGYYVFVHWPESRIEARHTNELVKIEDIESFIQQSLIWHV